MHYPGDVDADQPHAGYRMPDEDDVLWPDSGYGDPDGGTDGGFALAGSHYGAAGSFARKGPARGFPPAPGQPPPVYPPGQFAAWNLPADGAGSVAAAWPGAASAEHGYGWPAAKGPGGAAYPPSVDVPSIQPWPADDDATGSASSWPGLAAPVAAATEASTAGASTTGASTAGASTAGAAQAVPAARTTAEKETAAPAAGRGAAARQAGPPGRRQAAPAGRRGGRAGDRGGRGDVRAEVQPSRHPDGRILAVREPVGAHDALPVPLAVLQRALGAHPDQEGGPGPPDPA